MEVTSKGLQEVNGCKQTAEAIFAERPPKQPEKADRLISLGRRLGDSFWNCLEDPLEPFRLDASKNAAPKKEISDGPDGLGGSDIVDYLLQDLVTRSQGATHDLQHAMLVQFLEHFVRGQHRLSMFFGGLLQSRAQLGTRAARRNFQRNRLSH